MNYTVQPFDTDHFNELVPLMQDCFGLDVDQKYFEWKYLKNPAGHVEGNIARAEDGRVVGFYGVIPEQYHVNGNIETIYQSCDTMTHSQFRRRGIFGKLARTTYDTLQAQNKLFIMGFGGETSTPGFLKMGWQVDLHVHHFFKPAQAIRLTHRSSPPKGTDIAPIPKEDAARWLSENALTPRFGKFLNAEFLAWRWSNPRIDYRFAKATHSTGSEGLLVYSLANDKAEIMCLEGADKIVRKSLSWYAQELLLNHKLRALYTFAALGSPFHSHLKENGFIRNPLSFGPLSKPVPIITLMPDTRRMQMGSLKHWPITPLEHDSF